MNPAHDMRPSPYAPRRSAWPGVLGAALVAAAAVGLMLAQSPTTVPPAPASTTPAAAVPPVAEQAEPQAAIATPAPRPESAHGASAR